jgi:hypothetical protein
MLLNFLSGFLLQFHWINIHPFWTIVCVFSKIRNRNREWVRSPPRHVNNVTNEPGEISPMI